MSIGILSVNPEDSATIPYSLHLDATSTVIILEGTVVLVDLRSPPKAMCLLIYAYIYIYIHTCMHACIQVLVI